MTGFQGLDALATRSDARRMTLHVRSGAIRRTSPSLRRSDLGRASRYPSHEMSRNPRSIAVPEGHLVRSRRALGVAMMGPNPAVGPEWTAWRTLIGPADYVPAAIERLLTAATDAEASAAYWELDNRVVVQGQLFEAAEAVARELVTRICSSGASEPGLSRALDLLVEFAYGDADASEVAAGNPGLGARCRDEIRKGMHCLRSSAAAGDDPAQAAIRDLTDRLESE